MVALGKRKAFVNFVTAESLLFLLAVTVLAFAARVKFLPFQSDDYRQLLHVWFTELRSGGGLAAIGHNFGDYTPPYFYLLALLTYLPIKDLFLIKMLSFAGDIVMAHYAMRIIRMKYEKFWGEIAYTIVIFLPSVLLNSAAWGEYDSLYAAALLACLCYLLEGRQYAAVMTFSIAFIFKPEAMFFAPFLLLMLLRRKIQWRSLFIVPAVYLVSMLPAVFAGRSFTDLLMVYYRQAGNRRGLRNVLPNLAIWYPNGLSPFAGNLITVLAVLLILAIVLYFKRLEVDMTDDMIVSLALLSVLLVPYVLPWMNERCYYMADVLSVIYAFFFPEKFYVPILTVLSSTYVVCHHLFGAHFINGRVLSVLMFCCLLWVGISTVFLSRDEKIEKVVRRKWLS